MHRRNLSLASVAVLMGMAIPIGAARALEQGSLAGAGLRSRQPATRPLTASPRASSRPAAALAPMPVDTPRPSATRALAPASTPVPPPTRYVAHFDTLAAGSALPSDAQCASEIATNPWEPRPQNLTANQTNVYAQGFRLQNSYLGVWAPEYERLVTGNYVGTTDQILRWAACKWGFDEDTVKAQAVVESGWDQAWLGDCNGGTTQPETHGCASVGILQVKGADIPPDYPGTWPAIWTSTAFNVDFAMGVRRLCFDGKETWLHDRNPTYAAGDLWGCIGHYYSGGWYDQGAIQYIPKVQAVLAARTWTTF